MEKGPTAVDLLYEQNASHGVRQGQGRETKRKVSLGFESRIDTVGAPDDESDRASLVAPAVDLLGELSAGRVCAAFIHDDLDGILRQGGPNPFRFGLHHFRDGALVPVFGFDGL